MATPSLAMIPSGYKATKLYSVLPTDAVGDFDVTRATTATRVNKSGLIEEVGVNVPRLDYSDGGCPVLLTEPQSRNDYLNSQAMVTQSVTTTADTYTVSFYGTGTITFSGTYTGSLVGTGANDLVQLTFTATAGSLVSTVSGTVDEAQCEKLSYATSRIRTLGSVVTRNADVINNAGDSSTFNSSQGVLYAEIQGLTDGTASGGGDDRQFSINNGGTSNSVIIGLSRYVGKVSAEIYYNGTLQSSGWGASGITQTDNNKIAVAWGNGTYSVYVNGVKTNDGSISNSPINLDCFDLDKGNGTNRLFAKTSDLRVYKTALSDAELIELTS